VSDFSRIDIEMGVYGPDALTFGTCCTSIRGIHAQCITLEKASCPGAAAFGQSRFELKLECPKTDFMFIGKLHNFFTP
jgi:hypothetical protein